MPWADVDDLNGQFECILYGNLYTDYGTIIQNIKHKTNTDLKVKSKGNEVLIPGSDTTPTGLARALFLEKENVILGGDINILSVKHDDGPFLAYELNKLKKELIIRIKGTTVKHLQNNDLKDIVVSLPSLEEQRKISSLFSRLDNTITLQQRKLNSLQKLKKGLLQKMFPKNGENIPEIRFPEFSDAWKQRKFSEVFEEYSEKKHPELPALTIIQGKGTILRDASDRNLLYDKANLASYKLVRKDDFIVHLRTFEGGLEKANSDGIVSPAYHIFHGKNTDTRFFYPFFRSKYFIDALLKPHVYGIRDGKSIDIEGMKTISFLVPSFEEQNKIGKFVETLDNTITLQQRKLESLQKLKKGLLQQMFI